MWEFIASVFCSLFGGCDANACREIEYADIQHTVCTYQTADIDIALHRTNSTGEPYGYLKTLEARLSELGKKPTMLMNGGMYHTDLGAVGLYVEAGEKQKDISTKGGWGNFHLLPNGVFWGKNGRYGVSETMAFVKANRKVDFATQSGPMLVINGKLHPRFLKDSDSLKIRNGVGISRDGKTIHFVISHQALNFWNFGELFQKELKTHNALFLDGSVSALRAKGQSLGSWRAIGPMIAVFDRPKKKGS